MVDQAALDERYMRRALLHAARGQGRTTPNPMVGALVVSSDGVVVGHGWHERAGARHAEVAALEAAGAAARGGTLYVTLEPCCHVGRTGPCTRRIIDAGIARVVAAMQDPDPRVSGRGFRQLREAGIEVCEGVCQAEARRLNQAFVTLTEKGRPLVILKAALTLDGCVAAAPGARTAISGDEANRRVQLLRAAVDAVAVGSQTLLVDDPLLTVRSCYRIRPLVRVVFDRRLRTPPSARLFSTLSHGPVIIVTRPGSDDTPRARALEACGATLVAAGSLPDAVAALAARDVSTLLVEGGPTLQRAFVEERLADRVHLLVAQHTLGPEGVRWLDAATLPLAGAHVAVEPRGSDIWIEADVHWNR